jgi:hypothetical protein
MKSLKWFTVESLEFDDFYNSPDASSPKVNIDVF